MDWGVAVLSCVCSFEQDIQEAIVRSNDETTYHSDALQCVMCAKIITLITGLPSFLSVIVWFYVHS